MGCINEGINDTARGLRTRRSAGRGPRREALGRGRRKERRERGGVWGRVIRGEKKTVLELVGEK